MSWEKQSWDPSTLNQTTYLLQNMESLYPTHGIAGKQIPQGGAPLQPHILQSNSQKSFGSSLRILNSFRPSIQSTNLNSFAHNHFSSKNKFAFGSSQIRRVKIFQQPFANQDPQQSFDGFSCIITNSPFRCKSSAEQSLLEPIQKPFQQQGLYQKQPEIGFGIGECLNRAELGKRYLFLPGPGSYEVLKSFQFSKDKKLLPRFGKTQTGTMTNNRLFCSQNMKGDQISDQKMKSFGKQKRNQNKGKIKQKWKQILIERKYKTSNLLFKMKQNIEQNLLGPEHQTKPKQSDMAYLAKQMGRRKAKKNQNNFQIQNKKVPKLLRSQLKQKTNSFLPTVDQFDSNYNLRYENKGPLYKYMSSNCFVNKNDHAFEAHFYKTKEKESQYIFLKGKSQLKSKQAQNSYFKSKLARKLF